ncbi:hypothetical protein FGG08_003329 [Glutinoglossum americanum]|uniref:Uncharacterized protein n=1 Tax=Glutinoglossum americanum TaxID=1670608 RepID=A0A9P8I2V5_9PEZI|nr:hypothetical protein FGG08_003329 [Glutinoglossum americanum]
MTHLILAKVLMLLQPRIDASNILFEILGRYTLSVAGKPPEVVRALSFRVVVWIKAIFDLQRTCLQSAKQLSIFDTQLIHPCLLFAVIRKIVDIRSQVYGGVSESEILEHRCFLAQAVLSGLRTLLLRDGSFSATEISDIRRDVSHWQSTAHVGLESAILEWCLNAIDHVRSALETTGHSSICRPACTIPKLGCSQTSVSLCISGKAHRKLTLEKIDQQSRTLKRCDDELRKLRGDAELKLRGDADRFWSIFDILWAVEGAFIQFCIESIQAQEVSGGYIDPSAFVAKLDLRIPNENCLKEASLGWCKGEGCNCYEQLPDGQYLLGGAIDTSLQYFLEFLKHRQQELPDSELEITGLSDLFGNYVETWLDEPPGPEPANGSPTVYMLNCPKLHAVPAYQLQDLLRQTPDSANFFTLDAPGAPCPRCPRGSFRKARRIEPFDRLSDAFDQRRRPHPLPAQDPLWEVESEDTTEPSPPQARRPSKSPSLSSSHTTSSKSTTLGRKGMINKVLSWGRTTKQEHVSSTVSESPKVPLRPQSYCFSADGQALILWAKCNDCIYMSAIPPQSSDPPTWSWHQYKGTGIEMVAGSRNKVVAVSKACRRIEILPPRKKLMIFDSPGAKPALRDIGVAVECIAMSRNGKYVGLALGKKVLIFDIEDSSDPVPYDLHQPDGLDLGYQHLSFTSDGTEAIIATLKHNGMVYIRVCSCDGQEVWSNKPREPAHPVSVVNGNDRGVTSVLYSSSTKIAIVAAFVDGSYTAIHSKSKRATPLGWTEDRKPKFQGAAQGDSGTIFALANAHNTVYKLDVAANSFIEVVKISRRRPTPNTLMAIAMPDDDTIYTFWMENKKMVLATIKEKKLSRQDVLWDTSCIHS